MLVRRLLPPLLCCALLGLLAWRVLQRPAQRAEETRIASIWETHDAAGRIQVLEQVQAYARRYAARPNRDFLTQAYLRCRRIDLAVEARWPAGGPTPSAADVRDFAREALRAVGWDDEAQRRPSALFAPASVALLDGGDEATRQCTLARLANEPVEHFYLFVRQASWERSPATRRVLADGCRARAGAEAQAGNLDPTWDIAAALVEERSPERPGTRADLDRLREFVEGPARVQFRGRWILACKALGASGDPAALASLDRVRERLQPSTDAMDRHDLAVLLTAPIASGRWDGEQALRAIFLEGHAELRVAMSAALGILARLAAGGDLRAQGWIQQIWQGPATTEPILREFVASAVLSEPGSGALAWAEPMAADLELPRTPPSLEVHALAYRVGQGTPAARAALLAWLVREGGEGVLEGVDPESAPVPVLTALRALHLAP